MSHKGCGVIWDFDGTLVDSRQKNLSVTRAIIEKFKQQSWEAFPALRNLANYEEAHRRAPNWRVFYAESLNMSTDEIDQVGSWWSEFQQSDTSVPKPIDGIQEVLSALSQFPHGIVSQNCSANIHSILDLHGLGDVFDSIIGYQEVGMEHQKPSPKGLMQCIEELNGVEQGSVFFIGDHVTDAICAHQTRDAFIDRGIPIEVFSIRAAYAPGQFSVWNEQPDFVAHSPDEIVSIVEQHR